MAWTVTRLLALFALMLTLLVLWAQTRAARRTIAAQAADTQAVTQRNRALEAELEALRRERAASAPPPQPDPPLRAAPALTAALLTALCEDLAPAVAVRPAPAGSLAARWLVSAGPWRWDGSAAATLKFDASGALETPWGTGRWGPSDFANGVNWADWSGRTHTLALAADGRTLASRRCGDGDALVASATQSLRSTAGKLAGGDPCAAERPAAASTDCGAGAVRGSPFRLGNGTAGSLVFRPSGALCVTGGAAPSCARRWWCLEGGRLAAEPFPGVAARGWVVVDDDQLVGASCGVDDAVVFASATVEDDVR